MAVEHPTLERLYAAWPPDDTEETIMGSDWHQLTIRNLCLGINEIARDEAGTGLPVPFQAVSQTTLLGLRRRGKTSIKAMPDVFVFKKPMDGRRPSFSIQQDGPPAVAIEVASDSTFDQDIDFEAGKGWIYAAAGIEEYLTIDTTGLLQEPPLQAWRLRDGAYVECVLDAGGIWWSGQVPIGIAVREGMAVVFDRAGRPQVRESEVGAELKRREALGRLQAKQEALVRLVQRRFGLVADDMVARITGIAEESVVDSVIDVAADVPSIEELEKHLR
jgi:hypothetical protein